MLPTLYSALSSRLQTRSGTIGWVMVTVVAVVALAVVGLAKMVF